MLGKHLLKGLRQGFRKALVKGFHKPLLKPFLRAWRERWVDLDKELHPVAAGLAPGIECAAPDPVANRLRRYPEAPSSVGYGQPKPFRRGFRRAFRKGLWQVFR